MAAPATVIVNPGFVLLSGTAPVSGTALSYACGANAEQRVRVTSITLCDVTKAGVTATVVVGGVSVLFQHALPADGSPLVLGLNESLTGVETMVVTAGTGAAVGVRATGELIFTT